MWAVRDIDFMQSLMQKTRRVSTIRIRLEHNDFTGKSEILLEDIEAGRELVPVITEAAKSARLAYQRLAQTQHINYQGTIPIVQPVESQTEDDVVSKLERLGALLDKGLLSPEEFAEQKAKLLGL
ncbi:MAG: SHOCT domain-containing protein [Acidobacteria bacterium]|nr:SHOCT domain-containing protein [Acidobacteriota bacterium]